MRNVLLITRNILKLTFRKKGNLFIVILLPLIGLLLSSLIYNNSGNGRLALGVIYGDNGYMPRDMVSYLGKSGKFKISELTSSDIDKKVTSGKIDCALIIPKGFSDGIYKGSPAKLELKSIKGATTTMLLSNTLNQYMQNLSAISSASGGDKTKFESMYDGMKKTGVSLEIRKVADPEIGKGTTSAASGFLILFMMMSASITASLMIKEKEEMTYYRIFASPSNSYVYILGNILANTALVFIQVLIINIGFRLFGINTYIKDYQFIIILLFMGVVSVALGILIVSFSTSGRQAGMLSTLIVSPTCMLGGCLIPLSIMPDFMQKIAGFMPQKWAIDSITKIQDGNSFISIVPNLAVLLAFGAAFFLIAAYRFKITREIRKFV
ncbi:MAG: ABC transporter permease, partial [Bacillota bacterium]|nr:ABC transporter permease [Bacillota bacterium]